MQNQQSSATAEGVAAYRAIESKRPEGERIIFDPYAQLFLGDRWGRLLNSPILRLIGRYYGRYKFPGFYGSLIARFRFMNQCISDCFSDHCKQLVILGAGYDMSGFCFRDILADARVFEVDHPATQEMKIEKLAQHGEPVPGNITYVSVDFETDDLEEKLSDNGYAPSQKTLFILEGVTYYLAMESVQKTLDFIVDNSAPGSRLAFDYLLPEVIDGTSSERLGREMNKLVMKYGEPYKFGLEPENIDKLLNESRFVSIQQSSPREVRDTCFQGNDRNLKVSHLFNFVFASTSPDSPT